MSHEPVTKDEWRAAIDAARVAGMSNAEREPTLQEQIEACEFEVGRMDDFLRTCDDKGLRTHRNRVAAAARTLRRVQECRQFAQEQIASGVSVAADLEGLIP